MNLTLALARLAPLLHGTGVSFPAPDDDGPYGPLGPVIFGPLLREHFRSQHTALEAARFFTATLLPLHQLEQGLPEGDQTRGVAQAIRAGVERMTGDCGSEGRRWPWWWPHPPRGGGTDGGGGSTDGGDEPRPISPLELSVLAVEFARVSVALGQGTLSQGLGAAAEQLLDLAQQQG